MCGIVGIISQNNQELGKIGVATQTLSKRGPDNQSSQVFENLALGHARLSIIDTTEAANQPFMDVSGRYTIVFNGEIFNFQELKEDLIKQGVTFKTNSDTEVLLYLYIKHHDKCLEMLNGFFAFAIFDKQNNSLFVTRDRMGIKPLLYYFDGTTFIFASELKAILKFNIIKSIDKLSLFNYFQFNYIPSNNSIFSKIKKLKPAHYIQLTNINELSKIQEHRYYTIPYQPNEYLPNTTKSYDDAKKQLHNLLDDAVQKRLITDVPIGTFLSGGIDSSVISTLAKRHKSDLNTFSIGYKDEPFFDETNYANSVAKKIGSKHHAFLLSNNDLYENLNEILDYFDEPFADSSAIAVYILCKHTKQHVSVALSGDGADEIFSGYNKHAAEFRVRHPSFNESLINWGYPLWSILPKSRNHKLTNINRQLYKFSLGAKLSNKERYWLWAAILDEKHTNDLFITNPINESDFLNRYHKRKNNLLKSITIDGDINEVFYTDTKMVLVNDMLKKVDAMSMANSLEVRTPFLDYRVVNFAFSLPVEFKINGQIKKKILQDTFKNELPEELYNRAKHGFEVPLLSWFRNELRSTIENDLLSDTFILEQGIFNLSAIQRLKKQLFSKNPNDTAATVWALIVFNTWWKKYCR
ncbi:MAG: asparagine synthase (glutamine-hydrolyzing) [Flavobacteriales bacterium]|nr:asparagine synthase (glutamine-hydrolyzing) [Flavobacteriales bacterium]